MGNFNKDIYMKGCHLITRFWEDTTNMYQFIFNPETKDFSDVLPCENGLEFELTNDGVYRLVTLKVEFASVTENGLKIGAREYSVEELIDIVNGNGTPNFVLRETDYDIDDTLSICNLKKCLAELELKWFRDMLKNCGSLICKNDEIKAQRDFIFIAVWLIEHYVELGNIEKAQVIYDSLRRCGNLCSNLLKNKKDCGCNG